MVACSLTFSDNFNNGYLDQTKWSNSYTDFSTWAGDRPTWMPDTFDFIPGGGLRIRADNRTINFPNGGVSGNSQCDNGYDSVKCYTSGAITTHGAFSQAYGYFETSAQLYPGPGVFPAFWMLTEGPFPAGAIPSATGDPISEIDIFEFNTSYLDFNWFGHVGSNSHVSLGYLDYDSGLTAFNPSTAYHKYAMAWTPTLVSLYVDDVLMFTSSTVGQLVSPMYLILDADLGGPGGAPSTSTPFPQFMNVAYVHAYQYQGETAGIPPALDWGKTTVSQQTVNPGDTITFSSSFINNTTYTMGGTVTGEGPHIGISITDYLNQIQYLTGTASVFNIPSPMAPGAVYPYTFTYTIPAETTLPYGVYNVHWGATTTPAMGYSVYSGGASTRITVVPQTLENLQSLNFKAVSGKPFSGSVSYGNNGLSMQMTGNMWQVAPLSYTILPATMLEFDFSSTGNEDVAAIGLFPGSNYSQTAAQKYLFEFAGNTTLGVQSFNHYQNANGTTHYMIPIGNYYTGSATNLVLVSSSSALTANATFNNIRIYETPTTLY
jgi:beta-glucanase (GH16 family)